MAHDLGWGKRAVNGSIKIERGFAPSRFEIEKRTTCPEPSRSIVNNHCYAEQKFPSQKKGTFLFVIGTFQVVTMTDSRAK
jgi:hypothetical protein